MVWSAKIYRIIKPLCVYYNDSSNCYIAAHFVRSCFACMADGWIGRGFHRLNMVWISSGFDCHSLSIKTKQNKWLYQIALAVYFGGPSCDGSSSLSKSYSLFRWLWSLNHGDTRAICYFYAMPTPKYPLWTYVGHSGFTTWVV